MKVGIVGSEGAKFTKLGEERARTEIRRILSQDDASTVVSGHCHLGGIDIWAEEEGKSLGKVLEIYPPKALSWEAGYKPRNLQIANNSDIVYCITVDKLPETYKGMTFPQGCYHCKKAKNGCTLSHIKSGGCWTALKSKRPSWIIIQND